MSTVTVFVGLDYHQKSVQVCVLDKKGRMLGNAARANDWQAVRDYAAGFGRVRQAAIEACCGAAHLAEELIRQAGWDVRQAHPGYVSRMKQNPDKSDFSDSRMLADLVRVGYLPQVWLAPQNIRELRDVVRLRAEVGAFNRFQSGKQLSRFCGLSPRNASSGERQADAGLIKAGNAYLRATLIQLAQRLMRTVPRWQALAASLKARGKPHNVAVAAVGNRFMRGLWHRMVGHPAPVQRAEAAA